MITTTDLRVRFGRLVALDGVNLRVQPGEAVALWGANGAGKSTLLRCVLGLVDYSGEVRVGGHGVRDRGKLARRLIGYVPQEIGFYDDLRAGEAIALVASLKGLGRVRAGEVLARVGLVGVEGRRVRELSGGMKQRLALAAAMLGDPPVLVLDEVTASLDAMGREELVGLLSGLGGAERCILFASHRVDEVAAIGTRVVLLDAGRVTGEVAPAALAGRLGAGALLHLRLARSWCAPAIDLLRADGLDARANGVGILVRVPEGAKGRPFRLLADASIPVEDFEVLPARAGGEA
jgi:ABC-type multidrug transport system ATPase subunit